MPTPPLLRIEKVLAQVHRQVWLAAELAENAGMQTTADDLMQLSEEIRRIHEASIKHYRTVGRSQPHRA